MLEPIYYVTSIIDSLDVIPFIKANIGKISPLERLYKAIDGETYITSRAELYHQIKCYVPQKFKTNGNRELNTKELLKQIKKSEGDSFAIVGKPASGKTTALRYLYYKLSKTRKCVYFQMKNVKNVKQLKKYLKVQAKNNRLRNDDTIIAFFDGLDEARFFFQNEDFNSMFLKGRDSEIFRIFRKQHLFLNNMIFGIRPEFFENPSKDLRYKKEKVSMRVYELQQMSNDDTLKVFKSLKILIKLDKKYLGDEARHYGKNRFPSKKEERRYIKLLNKILKNSEESIFHYPMYVRYAYAFMKEYENQLNPDLDKKMEDRAVAFDILVNAIMKWEYHIYYGDSVQDNPERWEKFSKVMNECMDAVVEVMIKKEMAIMDKNDGSNDEDEDKNSLSNNTKKEKEKNKVLSRSELKKILNNYSLLSEEGIEELQIAIAHCFMVTDAEGQNFDFCHETFYEYFLAKYLISKGDFKTRKHFVSSVHSENFQHMYYSFLCRDKDVCKIISGSIANLSNKMISLEECMKLQQEKEVKIIDTPVAPMLEIYEYLPTIQNFLYRGIHFTQDELDEIMDCGVMDLTKSGWERVQYASALVPSRYVEELILRDLPLKDVTAIEEYSKLVRLDLRIQEGPESLCVIHQALDAIRGISLEWLHIYTNDGLICDEINSLLERKELNIERVYVETADYAAAYLKLYQLKQQTGDTGRFYVSRRTSLEKARLKQGESNAGKSHDLLKAVFELEADETGLLGLDKEDAEATIWNGLSLAEYYYYLDWTDEDKCAREIFSRLEAYIKPDGQKLSVLYAKAWGILLIALKENSKAKEWLSYAYSYSKKYFSKTDIINIAFKLFKVYIRLRDTALEEFEKELYTLVKETPDYIEKWQYLRYLEYSIVRKIVNWKKEKKMPDYLLEQISHFYEKAVNYAEKEENEYYLISSLYFALVTANRTENTAETERLLLCLKEAMLRVGKETDEREKQGNWMKYQEQKIYYLFLTGKNAETIAAIDDLMAYPFRDIEKSKKSCRYIREVCTQGEERVEEPIDRHRLWNSVWY